MSDLKPYNLQSISIYNFLNKVNKIDFLKDLGENPNKFFKKHEPMIVKDLQFKNHSFETRNMRLISPEHYFYFTKLVFRIVLSNESFKSPKSYSFENSNGYYSGFLLSDINSFDKRNAVYNISYSRFLDDLVNYTKHEMLYVDISSFFDSISISRLIIELKKTYRSGLVDDLALFFDQLEIKTLPQFHTSIASSILSQEYLRGFDNDLQKILINNDLKLIRFVDDMYFINTKNKVKKGEKFYYTLLDQIGRLAWKYNLTINTNKVKVFSGETPFSIELMDQTSFFQSEKRIEDKANEITGEEFLQFVTETSSLYMTKGFNFNLFKQYFNHCFSIKGEDAQKVLNNFIYSGKWRNMNIGILKKVIKDYYFVYYLPNPLLILYLKIYDYVEIHEERDSTHIKKLVKELDTGVNTSIILLHSAINYLIQRGFKRLTLLDGLEDVYSDLRIFMERYIIESL